MGNRKTEDFILTLLLVGLLIALLSSFSSSILLPLLAQTTLLGIFTRMLQRRISILFVGSGFCIGPVCLSKSLSSHLLAFPNVSGRKEKRETFLDHQRHQKMRKLLGHVVRGFLSARQHTCTQLGVELFTIDQSVHATLSLRFGKKWRARREKNHQKCAFGSLFWRREAPLVH